MLKPYEFDFSHPALRSCFSIELVKKLKKVKGAYDELLNLAGELDEKFVEYCGKSSEYGHIYGIIRDSIDSGLSGVKDMFDRNWEDFFQHYHLERRCENCGVSLRADSPINKAHIIRRPFFKRQGTKIYKDVNFEHHMANTLILCVNCHDRIEKKGVNPRKRLLNRRVRLKDRMLVELEADIGFLNEKIWEITGFLFEIESYENELREELNRKMMEKIEEWAYSF